MLNEAALKHIRELIGDLEATSDKPFNRFTDTQALEAIDLNFRYAFDFSLFRRLSYAGRSAGKICNSCSEHRARSLQQDARGFNAAFIDRSPHLRRA